MEIIDPDGRRALSLAEAAAAQSFQLTRAGFYHIRFANGKDALIGVNPDRRESDLRAHCQDLLQLWGKNPGSIRGSSRLRGGKKYRPQHLVVRYAACIGGGGCRVHRCQPLPRHTEGGGMSNSRTELNLYIHQLHQRLRLGVSLRGVAILTATALITTVLLVLILNAFAFPVRGLTGARSLLLIVIALAAAFALALPLLRLTRRRATAVAESVHPEFQQRLLTFDDREKKGNDPFLELLAADTLSVARDAQPAKLVPNNKLYFLAGAGAGLRGRAGLAGCRGTRLSRLWSIAALDRAKGYAAL